MVTYQSNVKQVLVNDRGEDPFWPGYDDARFSGRCEWTGSWSLRTSDYNNTTTRGCCQVPGRPNLPRKTVTTAFYLFIGTHATFIRRTLRSFQWLFLEGQKWRVGSFKEFRVRGPKHSVKPRMKLISRSLIDSFAIVSKNRDLTRKWCQTISSWL